HKQVQPEQRGQTEQPDLLTEAREDEVALDQRYLVRAAHAGAGAEQATGAEPEQRLDQLEPAAVDARLTVRAGCGAERVEPDVGALVEIGERTTDHAAEDVGGVGTAE